MPHSKYTVTPIKLKPQDDKHILTPDHLAYIQNILEMSLPTGCKQCISRSQLYDAVKDPLELKMEQYQFERLITVAVKDGLLIGFITRHGRNGGICRAEDFLKEEKPTKKKRVYKNCTVTVAGQTYNVQGSEDQVSTFIVSVLGATPTTNGLNAIYINNRAYTLPSQAEPEKILQGFMVFSLNAQLLHTADSKLGQRIE